MNTQSITIDNPRSLFAAVSFSAVAIVIFNALPVIMGVASDSLGLTAEQLGLLASVELGGIGLTSVSGLYWIRRVPWRRAVLLATLVLVAGNLLSAYMVDVTSLIALRFLTGLLGEGVVFTITMAAVGDARDTDKAYAYSIVGQVGLGMLALFLFPYVAASLGYKGVMGAMAVLALSSLAFLSWLPVGGEKAHPEHDNNLTASRRGSSTTTTFLGLLGMTCWFIGLSGIWTFVERIGAQIPVEQTSIGLLLAVGLGLGALASLVVALVGDRYGRYWPPMASLVVHALICLVMAGEMTVFIYSAVVLGFTFIWNLGLPYLLGLIADSDVSGRLVVLIVSAQAFGNTIGPLLAGNVVELKGLGSVGFSSALLCVLALAIIARFIQRMAAQE